MPIKKSKNVTKKPRQKEIIYPILKECSLIVKDRFWKQFYEDLSSGKSTKGLYISNGVIQTSNKRNGFYYPITDKAPEVIVTELHRLLTTHTNICSRKDLNQKLSIVKVLKKELSEYDNSEWTSIKRKNVRNMLIVEYAIRLHKELELSWASTIQAYHTILNAFENKTHSSKDVVYSKGKIHDILDIEYDEETKNMINTRKIEVEDEEKEEIITEPGISLQSMFESYVNACIKHVKSA
jgi:hypothetical protein